MRQLVLPVRVKLGSAILHDKKDGSILIVPHAGYLKRNKDIIFIGLVNKDIDVDTLFYGYFTPSK